MEKVQFVVLLTVHLPIIYLHLRSLIFNLLYSV